MEYKKSVNGVVVDMTPEERARWDRVQAPPPLLTPRQLRLMLLNIGITEAMVAEEIATIADEIEREAARIEWEWATTYRRDHPLVVQMASVFSLPEDQVDALWRAAADL